eukprot:3656757-Pyramimonas_sp.AAC.1
MLERRDWIEWMVGKWRDQKSFRMLLNEHPDLVNKVFVVDPPTLQAYPRWWVPGTFIYHQVRARPE